MEDALVEFLKHIKDQGLKLVSIDQILDHITGVEPVPDLSGRPIAPEDVKLFPEFGPARFVTPLEDGQIGR